MNCFLTGANGFIGSQLALQLAARGDRLVCIVRDPSRVEPALRLANIEWVKGDVTEPSTLRVPMRGADAVFHLAGMYKFGPKYLNQMRAVNVDGTQNVIACAAESGVPRIIHTSTIGVFGNTRGAIVDETYKCAKEELPSEYERTKWEAHYEVAVAWQARGAPVIITQPGAVTGPADPSPHILQAQLFLRRMPIGFGAKSGVTWSHVQDSARGHILAAERGKAGESYIITGPALTWRQSAELWSALTGIPAPRVWMPGWMVAINQQVLGVTERLGLHLPFTAEGLSSQIDYTFWGTPKKAEREIGWQSRPIEETFREMLDYEMKKLGMTPPAAFP
jgi:nucleoside-diphosphate-sugar epimerase